MIAKATKDATPNAATIGTAKIRFELMNPDKRSERKVVGSSVTAETEVDVVSKTFIGATCKDVVEDKGDRQKELLGLEDDANATRLWQGLGAKASAVKAMQQSKQVRANR